MRYFQCRLQQGDAHTVGWIEERGARKGAQVEILLNHIVQEYGNLDKEKVAEAIVRIQKRLGGLETKTALQHLATGDVEACFRILLKHYDKSYRKAIDNRNQSKALVTNLDCNIVNARLNADKILSKELLLR